MIKKFIGEVWKPLQFPGWKQLRKKYAVSNYGRAASYNDNIINDGKILNGSLTTGYRTLNLHRPDNKGTIYIHREIAKIFCKRKSAKHKYVIHLNHKKLDNSAKNLRWSTLEEMAEHQQSSPQKIAYKQKQRIRAATSKGLKLTPAQVKTIKKIIHSPKRKITYKQLAKKYKVSEMTLYRIRSGENWSLVK
ncbi:MAG TPA: NUMOD4 domain-containing protein [Chitinophagaceae bacterium]|nr:NUMOD4 domain-containing protein [Chitinophagaceae bacterium]